MSTSKKKQGWLLTFSYVFTTLGFLAGIASSFLGLSQIMIGAIVSLFFGAGSFLIAVHGTLSKVQEQLERIETEVQCFYVGDDEDALRYVAEQYKVGHVQRVRDTHMRLEEHHSPYTEDAYTLLQKGLNDFLDRPNTHAVLVTGRRVDKKLIGQLVAVANDKGEHRFTFHKLHSDGPIMNLLILDYVKGEREVLFGWGRRAPGQLEAVFRSKDERLVREFENFYNLLTHPSVSKEVTIRSLLEGDTSEQMTTHAQWPQHTFDELLSKVERGTGEEADLKIATIAFTGGGAPEDILKMLVCRGVRVHILLLHPKKCEEIIRARNKIRAQFDGETPDGAIAALEKQIKRLDALKRALSKAPGTLEFRLSEIMPCGFVAHSSKWAALGLFVATGSYGDGPLILIDSERHRALWEKLGTEWKARWDDAPPQIKEVASPKA